MFGYKMRLISSFKAAFNGLFVGFKEKNMHIHAVAAAIVLVIAAFFNLTAPEYAVLIIVIMAVFCAELFNTAIEKLTDIVSPQYSKAAGIVKDIAASAVLVCAIGSAAVGIIIFGRRILALFNAM